MNIVVGAEKIELANGQPAFDEELLNKESIPCETHLPVRGMTPGKDTLSDLRRMFF